MLCHVIETATFRPTPSAHETHKSCPQHVHWSHQVQTIWPTLATLTTDSERWAMRCGAIFPPTRHQMHSQWHRVSWLPIADAERPHQWAYTAHHCAVGCLACRKIRVMYVVMSYILPIADPLFRTTTLRLPHATSRSGPPTVKHMPPCASLLCAHP